MLQEIDKITLHARGQNKKAIELSEKNQQKHVKSSTTKTPTR